MFDDALGLIERMSTIAERHAMTLDQVWDLCQSIAAKENLAAVLPPITRTPAQLEDDRFDPVVERVTKEQELNGAIDWLFAVVPARRKAILEQAGVTIDNERTTLLKIVDKEFATGLVKVAEINSAIGWEYRTGNPFPDRLHINDEAVLASLQGAPWKIVAVAPHRQGGVCLLALALVSKTHAGGEYFVTQGVTLDA